ncbi:extracellular solute-binding protein [Micrococcales bacterium 31B]|nr:extracellular solute-binding protein [Micrococcales bacterium 31B]
MNLQPSHVSRRHLLGLGATAGTAALLAACGSGSTGSTAPTVNADDLKTPANLRVWFMKDSVTQGAQDWLKAEYEKNFPGSTLTIEIQQWTGIVPKLQTSLSSEGSTPDIVEFGNTQVPTFVAVNALSDLTDLKTDLGGADLIQSFVDLGSMDGKMYAAPFYAGSRLFIYRKDYFDAAGITAMPKTLDELAEVCATLQAANPAKNANWTGAFLPGVSSQTAYAWIFTNGGTLATHEGDKWTSQFSAEPAQKAVTQLQHIWKTGSKSGTVADPLLKRSTPLNANETAMVFGFKNDVLQCTPEIQQQIGYFEFPPAEAGGVGHPFAGGSNIAIAAKSKNQAHAREVMKLIFAQPFQEAFAKEGGWVPGNLKYASALGTDDFSTMLANSVKNSVATPANKNWATIEASKVIDDFWVSMGKLGDGKTAAAELDQKLNEALNKA